MEEYKQSVHLVARSYQDQMLQEIAARETSKDQRRKGLARGLMNKYTRELLNKNSTSAQNYYFQHTRLNSLFTKKPGGLGVSHGGELDGSKGLDLNSVVHLAVGIEDETQTIGAFGSFINILRHLLLIPTDSGLASRMWSLIEMFVHQIIIAKDDGRKDIAKIGVDDFKAAFDAKDNPNLKERHKAIDCVNETLAILFPKLAAGNYDTDPNFQSPPVARELQRKLTSKISKATLALPAVAKEEAPSTVADSKVPASVSDDHAPQSDSPISEDPVTPPPLPPSAGPPPPPPPPPPKRTTVAKPTMKRLNWVKLIPQQIHDTVFEDKSTIDRIPVLLKDLENKFALKSSASTISVSLKTKGAVLHLLDPKKAQNLGILLTSIRAPAADIRHAIVSLDSSVLSVGNAISLLKLLPTEDEKAVLLDNKGAILGKPETFLLELIGVPLLKERLEGYILKKEFEFRVEDATKTLAECRACLDDVHNSLSLKTFLRFVLDVGNAMNKGYTDRNGGDAYGFKLSSILKLQDTKTCDNKSNLLFYIVEYLGECSPSVLEMANKEMPCLKFGIYAECANSELKDLIGQLKSLELALQNFVPMDSGDPFLSTMTAFVPQAQAILKALSMEVEDIKALFNQVSHYYGEDGEQEDVVSTLLTFCNVIEKTMEDVAFVHEEAEKSAKKETKKRLVSSQPKLQAANDSLPSSGGSTPLKAPNDSVLRTPNIERPRIDTRAPFMTSTDSFLRVPPTQRHTADIRASSDNIARTPLREHTPKPKPSLSQSQSQLLTPKLKPPIHSRSQSSTDSRILNTSTSSLRSSNSPYPRTPESPLRASASDSISPIAHSSITPINSFSSPTESLPSPTTSFHNKSSSSSPDSADSAPSTFTSPALHKSAVLDTRSPKSPLSLNSSLPLPKTPSSLPEPEAKQAINAAKEGAKPTTTPTSRKLKKGFSLFNRFKFSKSASFTK